MTPQDFITMVQKFELDRKQGIIYPIPIKEFGISNTEMMKRKYNEEVQENEKKKEIMAQIENHKRLLPSYNKDKQTAYKMLEMNMQKYQETKESVLPTINQNPADLMFQTEIDVPQRTKTQINRRFDEELDIRY